MVAVVLAIVAPNDAIVLAEDVVVSVWQQVVIGVDLVSTVYDCMVVGGSAVNHFLRNFTGRFLFSVYNVPSIQPKFIRFGI